MSIVSSDSNVIREQIRKANFNHKIIQGTDFDLQMSRMSWLWALRPLFDSLQSLVFDSKKRYIEKANFLDALEKVKPTLDLRDPAQIAQSNQPVETCLSYRTVTAQFEENLPDYFTWDNLFDVLLFNSVASQFVYDLHGPVDFHADQDSRNEDMLNGEREFASCS